MAQTPPPAPANEPDRETVLHQLEAWLDKPMLLLAIVWLALLVVELAWGLNSVLEAAGTFIWIVFVLEFLLRLALAEHKLRYLKQRWLTALSLVIPALRVFQVVRVVRVLRLARATRGLRLVRVVATVNRSMRSLGASMGRRGLGYVLATTTVVLFAGAAGMYAFEARDATGAGFADFGTALWWTAMVLTTMGSDYWPRSAEGRVLCLMFSVYAFAVFGYVTAALASYFIGREAEHAEGELAGQASVDALRGEMSALQAEMRGLAGALESAMARRDDLP